MANDDEIARKQWARRRLIGAVTLALLIVVLLPMVFENTPRPLSEDVELVIPGRDTPFTPAPAAPVEPVPNTPAASAAGTPVTPSAPPVAAPAPTVTAPTIAPPAAKPTTPVTALTPAKPPAATTGAPASAVPVTAAAPAHAYYLQLGIFANESNARKQAEKAAKAGLKVAVSEDGGKFRVRVGPYGERERALAVQKDMQKQGIKTVLVGS